MDSELVQRLQKQLLDLRTENCDFGERTKFLASKLTKVTGEKDEIEKELRLLSRKNKAFSFLPGQSSRDEIMKLQDENEHLNQALEKQELDFQRHDQALRDEIGLLQKQVQMAQNSTTKQSKQMKKSSSKSSVQSHPLDNSGDSGLDVDELERQVASLSETKAKNKAKLEEQAKAIKQLESMVKLLRAEKEDATAKVTELNKSREKMSEIKNKAENRKKMSDQLAKEVTELKGQLAALTKTNETQLQWTEQKHTAEKESAMNSLNEQLEAEKEMTKTAELKAIDANRRIDRLISEKQELEKVVYQFEIVFNENRASEVKNKRASSSNVRLMSWKKKSWAL